MSQFVKPIADKRTTSWTGNNVGGSNLYQEVDETVAAADDFTSYDVTTIAGNSDGSVLVWKVTSVTTPDAGTATVRLRTYASQTATYFLEIRSGYVDESNKGTLLGTTSTQNHPGDGAWHTLTDSAVTYAGGGDGTDLYFRLVSHATSGSSTTAAVTAVDADLPNAPTGHNLSGTPDILATTPVTGSGSGKNFWALSGAPNLTVPTGTGTMTSKWNMSGAPDIFATTPLRGAGQSVVIFEGLIGAIVVATVDGQRVGGLVLKPTNSDGLTLIAIGVERIGGLWRWDREVLVADPADVSLAVI